MSVGNGKGVSPIFKLRLLILLFGLFFLSGCAGDQEEKEELKQHEHEFKSYLQEKYGEPFEIKEISKVRKYFGGPIIIRAKVFPAGQEKLVFRMSAYEEEGKFTEDYLATKWSREAEELTKQAIEEVYGKDVEYQFSFFVKENIMKQEIISKKEQSLSYALSQFNDQLDPFVHIIDVKKKVNHDIQFLELYDFISFLKEHNLQNTRIHLEIYSNHYKNKIARNPKKFLELGFTDRVRYEQDKIISFSILVKEGDTSSVKSPEDIARIYYND
ncbi:hypothetical protein A8F94_07940 [Bacillus sp. FJAT-27225]|uniref:hypothetical protein n=1 Tax=Bacillus sp. FJAT-27225 TaxID=1743144 RepID=UPI00080C2856|nr:hypothetical protein [Bacillus sp. FJAT-27225]OCA87770.1 hypothetical protein A8F94_07940 [Bacillus sp. FJAT-27225]